MKEPEHRDVTFRSGSFGRFAKKYRIEAEITPVDPLGFQESRLVRKTRWFVASLDKEGRTYTTQIEFLRYKDTLPSVEDVLDYMFNIAVAHEELKGDVGRAMRVTGYPDSEARQWLQGISEDVHAIKWFLGPEAYAEFLTIRETPRE
jgi:hypothetical protein